MELWISWEAAERVTWMPLVMVVTKYAILVAVPGLIRFLQPTSFWANSLCHDQAKHLTNVTSPSGKQLMFAITMYGTDNHDFFLPNPDDTNTMPGYNWCSGNASIGGPADSTGTMPVPQ